MKNNCQLFDSAAPLGSVFRCGEFDDKPLTKLSYGGAIMWDGTKWIELDEDEENEDVQ